MRGFHFHHLLLLLLLLLLVSSTSAKTATATAAPSPLVRSACAQARFPALCIRTLAPRSPTSASDLARVAVSASLSATRGAASFLRQVPAPPAPGDLAAIRECGHLLLDAAERLARAADQLSRLRPSALPSQLGDAQTWTSAAMTDQDMCALEISGLAERTRDAVLARVTEASQLTSNALYLIARLAAASGRNR
ncbi:hypothetical protein Cni_G15261 [Canna indica]|uniref:Pectinesterase inhibitor domain-containing protein n=1 Tax=Canna indica TaxID=4628 RepID=A0AAQ3KHM3_9LILI|nr:hypothetical protein Cni_G15261 [Canna indica]